LAKIGIDYSTGKLRRLAKTGKIASFMDGNRYKVSMPELVWAIVDTSSPLWTKKALPRSDGGERV